MAEKSYPFTSIRTEDTTTKEVKYDRAISAEFLRALMKKDRSNGVITMNNTTALQVTQTTTASMAVNVQTGYAFINGATYCNDEIYKFNVQQASSQYTRYDFVVLRLDTSQSVRRIYLRYVTGTPAQTPVSTYTPTRSGSIYELVLARIQINKAQTTITNSSILDYRLNSSMCGVSIPYQSIDTTGWYNQIKAQIDENLELIKSALDKSTAGYLSNRIDKLETMAKALWPVGSIYITINKNETTPAPATYISGSKWVRLSTNIILRNSKDGTGIGNVDGADTYKFGMAAYAYYSNWFSLLNDGEVLGPYVKQQGDSGWIQPDFGGQMETSAIPLSYNSGLTTTTTLKGGSNRYFWNTWERSLKPYTVKVNMWKRTA